MRLLVVILAATTLTFAASTVYLARELQAARSVAARAPPPGSAANASMAPGGEAVSTTTGRAPDKATASATASASTSFFVADSASVTTSGQQGQSVTRIVTSASPDPAAELAKLEDPAQRAKMLEDRKHIYRSAYQGLGEYMGLEDDQFERFIELIGKHELEMQEAGLRCYIDTACKSRGYDPTLASTQRREIADQFGAQAMDSFEYFRRTHGERQMIKELRARLPDKSRLMDAQSEPLVTALHEEQQRIGADIRQRGVEVSNFNGVVYVPAFEGEPDPETQQAASQYNRMLRDRAATVLTPEQLSAYERMQAEALRSYQSVRFPPRARVSSEGN